MALLFSPDFISPDLQKTLPEGFILRPLCSRDYEKGFLAALSHLTNVGSISRNEYLDRFFENKSVPNHYYTIVIEDERQSKIAAAGTILVEQKFVHQNGLAGHIEDIVVHEDYRGKNFGKWIIEQLKYIGEKAGCYKIILDCAEKNVAFYSKCGFIQKEIEMVMYIDKNDKSKSPGPPKCNL